MNTFLAARLRPALARHRAVQLSWQLGLLWLALAAAGGGLLRAASAPSWAWPLWWVLGVSATFAVLLRWWLAPPDYRKLARRLEQRYADLDGRLLTAVQVEEEGTSNFIQERLLRQTIEHSIERKWRDAVPEWQLWTARAFMALSLVGVVTVASLFRAGSNDVTHDANADFAVPPPPPGEIEVTPGDTELEKGSSLVILARFGNPVPAAAELIMGHAVESERRVPLVKNFNDPIFGGSVPNVTENLRYRVEAAGLRSRDFSVTVFEYPKLDRADAQLTYPAYTQLPPRRLEDTRRLSAVEGTTLDLSLQLNKPVARAMLQPRPRAAKRGQPEEPAPVTEPIVLTVDPTQARAALSQFVLRSSAEYDLQLTDAEGRENKTPVRFSFEVVPNRPPEIKLARPRGDQRPSALEELVFEGTAWDDFGVLAYGIALGRAGSEPRCLELGREVPGQEKQAFRHLWAIEEEGADPDALFTWFTWAEDLGPDGQRRRTTGDLYFAEIRPFEEIFRQGEDMSGGEQEESSSAPSGSAQQVGELAELQKQIINATWKLHREVPTEMTAGFRDDMKTVRASQSDALEQARAAAQQAQDARIIAGWQTAVQEMAQAESALARAENEPAPVAELLTALGAEQRAYQALVRVQAREHQVSRSRQRRSSNSGEQSRQGELDQLELTEEENRYESQRLASSPQDEERQEQLQVLNRLQELARRQEAVTDRLKEVQAALAEAKTEEQREELRRELKRLEEEQRELLADADELNQRLDRPENQQSLAQERQQMQEVREQLQQAASATAEGNVPQAVASGTRAQEQLQEMRDELRERNSSALQEALRDLRAEARDLARRQEQLSQTLGAGETPDNAEVTAADDTSAAHMADAFNTEGANESDPAESRPSAAPQLKSLTDEPSSEEQDLARQLAEQRERAAALVEKATELSAEAEAAEPLASRQLYESVRQFVQEDAGGVKELREEVLREGRMTRELYQQFQEWQEEESAGKLLAATAELAEQKLGEDAARGGQRARAALEALRRGVEGATENVLSDDTEALKRADRELAELTRELERELREQREQAAEEGEAAGSGRATEPGTEASEDTADGVAPLAQTTERAGPEAGASPRASTGEAPSSEEGDLSAQAEGSPAGQSGQDEPSEREPAQAEAGQGQPGNGEAEGGRAATATAASEGEGRAQARSGVQQGRAQGGRRTASAAPEGRGGGGGPESPLTGEAFAPWSDRLRNVEEMLEFPDLRSGVATARERARVLRREFQRDLKKPDWAVVELEVLRPLVEVRQHLREELARRTSDEALVPIDRDPVPSRYTELVRRYYEELGRDQPSR